MLINCSELNGKHKNDILAHALLASPHPNIDAVLHLKGKDRVIDVKVLFNGVEYDGQLQEDTLSADAFMKDVLGQTGDVISKQITSYTYNGTGLETAR